jgi:hypothetical protein
MKILLILIMSTVFLSTAAAQTATTYKKVDHVLWVVKEMKPVIKGWNSIGFTSYRDLKTVSCIKHGLKDEKAKAKAVEGALGGLNVLWIQPINGDDILSRHLAKNGEGAVAIIHKVTDQKQLDGLVSELAKANIGKIATYTFETKNGNLHYTIMDTREQGKYYLGFVIDERTGLTALTGENHQNLVFNQFAFAIRDPKPISDFWVSAGLPEFEITHGELWDKEYFGKPANFDMNLGWQRHGNIVYEWCIPLKSPTVYEDHMRVHGEGIQHFGLCSDQRYGCSDQFFTDKGYKISMSGGWGEKGKEGSGRFTYVDLSKIGGMTIELLWNQN